MEVGEYTFLTLFDADIEARLDRSGGLEVELGPRNARDSIVGIGRQTVRSRGRQSMSGNRPDTVTTGLLWEA